MGLISNIQNVPNAKPEVGNLQSPAQEQPKESPSIWSQLGDFCQQLGGFIQENAFPDVDKQAWKDYQEVLEQAKKEALDDSKSPLEDIPLPVEASDCPEVPDTTESPNLNEPIPSAETSDCPEVPDTMEAPNLNEPNQSDENFDHPEISEASPKEDTSKSDSPLADFS